MVATSINVVTVVELTKEIHALHEKKNQQKILTEPPSMKSRLKLYLKRKKRHGIIANAPVEPPHMPTSDDTHKKRIRPRTKKHDEEKAHKVNGPQLQA